MLTIDKFAKNRKQYTHDPSDPHLTTKVTENAKNDEMSVFGPAKHYYLKISQLTRHCKKFYIVILSGLKNLDIKVVHKIS